MRKRRHRHAVIRWLAILLLGAPMPAHDAAPKNRGDEAAGARLAASMTVVQAGSASRPVVYEIRLVNHGTDDQPDDPDSDEFVDVLPPQLALRIADADSGAISVDLAGNIVRWNGALAVGAKAVTIRIEADVTVTRPMTIRNQASVFCDSNGDGHNDNASLSTDPSHPGEAIPTAFRFAAAGAE
jgi:hypothetical protein